MFTIVWTSAIAFGKKVALYFFEVAGALDRVRAARFVKKLVAMKRKL